MSRYFIDETGWTVKGIMTVIMIPVILGMGITMYITIHDEAVRYQNMLDEFSCDGIMKWILSPQEGTIVKTTNYQMALDEYNKRCKV